MNEKNTIKIIFITFCLWLMLFVITPVKAQAALQSNGGTPEIKSLNDWVLQVRNMQSSGGTLGRADTINTTDLTSNATDLDIHMEKNTEYGAMAILSASSYGNPGKIENGQTTTGNETGIIINLNKEWVAATTNNTDTYYIRDLTKNMINAKDRYKNIYDSKYVAKYGDAMNETVGWHGSYSNTWEFDYTTGLLRGYAGSLFSYYARKSEEMNWSSPRVYDSGVGCYEGNGHNVARGIQKWTTRAVVVVGENL